MHGNSCGKRCYPFIFREWTNGQITKRDELSGDFVAKIVSPRSLLNSNQRLYLGRYLHLANIYIAFRERNANFCPSGNEILAMESGQLI